jgi:aryl-alcohol dehydrogenase-like predicted oxidoreductase
LLHGILSGKFASADDIVPPARARSRHFSNNRPHSRHGEEGCETEVFAAIDEIRQIASELQLPMQIVAVSWVLQQPGVASVILGARNPEQIRQMAAVTDYVLESENIQALSAATEPVKQKLGPNPDMWMSESRFR